MSRAAPLALSVDSIGVQRGERAILSGVTFRLAAGEALIVTGDNGSGKTTLLRAIAGFLPLNSGRATLTADPAANAADEEPLAARCHLIGHLDGLKGTLTVRENLAFWAEFLGEPAAGTIAGSIAGAAAGRMAAALAAFDLTALADIPAAYLSAGQKRRLGLTRLLVAHRPLWLLDEPSVSLDAASVNLLRRIIAGHLAGGGLVVAATHVDLGIANARHLVLGQSQTLANGDAANPGAPA